MHASYDYANAHFIFSRLDIQTSLPDQKHQIPQIPPFNRQQATAEQTSTDYQTVDITLMYQVP